MLIQSGKGGSMLPDLIFTSDQLFTFSALHHLPEDLQSVLHPEEALRSPRPFTCLNLDYKHMGVGSDDSWYELLTIHANAMHLLWLLLFLERNLKPPCLDYLKITQKLDDGPHKIP